MAPCVQMIATAARCCARAASPAMGTRGLWVSAAGWKGRDLVKLSDFSTEDVKDILNLSAALKKHLRKRAVPEFAPLAGESLSMIFQKRSTRTRVSTETGMAKLGGQALFLSSEDIQVRELARAVGVGPASASWQRASVLPVHVALDGIKPVSPPSPPHSHPVPHASALARSLARTRPCATLPACSAGSTAAFSLACSSTRPSRSLLPSRASRSSMASLTRTTPSRPWRTRSRCRSTAAARSRASACPGSATATISFTRSSRSRPA